MHTSSSTRLQDTRVVWTLEENTQQKAGIPREFTFVLLLERPVPKHSKETKMKLRTASTLSIKAMAQAISSSASVSPKQSQSSGQCNFNDIHIEQSVGLDIRTPKEELSLHIPDRRLTRTVNPNLSIIDNLRAEASKLTKKLHINDPSAPITKFKAIHTRKASVATSSTIAYEEIFPDIEFSISVRPDVAGMNIPRGVFEHHAQVTTIKGQVGQKFSSMHDIGSEAGACIGELYDFTRLPVNFEDLIELPGSTVSTVVSLVSFDWSCRT
jgi:hypothetical protein